MDRSKQLGEEKVGKLLWNFSLPAIVGMVVNALYNVIDTYFVGNGVGPLALTATSLAFPITQIIMAFGMLVGVGSTAVISIKLGQQRKNEAEKILGNALTLTIIISIILSAIGLTFLNPILVLFGASGQVLTYGRQFMTIILCGIILQNIGFGLNNIIRAEGNPRTAMLTMIIGAVINTILNPIFIFVLKLGIRGSALATIISQSVTSSWVLLYFLGGKSMLKLRRKNLIPRGYIMREIASIGFSPFLMQVAGSMITVTLNSSLGKYGGDLAIASFGIINRFNMLILMPIFGINQGAQPIVGYNYGAKLYSRVKKTLKYAITAGVSVATVGFIVVQSFPRAIIGMFGKGDIPLINIGAHGIRIFLAMLPVIGFQIVCTNYFQAIGRAKISAFLSLSRQVIILLPLLLILPRLFNLGLNGVWLAAPCSDLISSIITGTLIVKEIRKLNIIEDNTIENNIV